MQQKVHAPIVENFETTNINNGTQALRKVTYLFLAVAAVFFMWLAFARPFAWWAIFGGLVLSVVVVDVVARLRRRLAA